MGLVVLMGILFSLGYIAIVKSEQRDAEKKRGDTLQQGIDALRDRSEQDRKFFEIVRQLLITQGTAERQALLDQLRGFKFSEPVTTTTTTRPRATSNSSTTPKTSTTTAPRPPPSTTTTTSPPPSPPPSQPTTCVTTPIVRICPPTAASSERKHA